MPTRERSSVFQNGLYGASKPSFTRRFCLPAWLVPTPLLALPQLFCGTYGFLGFEKKKLSASSVPS